MENTEPTAAARPQDVQPTDLYNVQPGEVAMPALQGDELRAQDEAHAEAAHQTLAEVMAFVQSAHDRLKDNPRGRGVRSELMCVLNRLTHNKTLI